MRKKLILMLILFSSVPLIIASFFSLYFYTQNMQGDFRKLSASQSAILEKEVGEFINKHMDLLRFLSKNAAIVNYDVPNITPIITEASKAYPSLIPISVDNDKGKQIVKSDKSSLVDVADRKFYQEAMGGKEEVVSEVVISKANNQPVVILGTPIRSKDNGSITGVLQGTINLKVLSDFVTQKSTDENIAYILDQEGKIIAHPDAKMSSERTNMSQVPFVQKALKGENGAEDILDSNGNKRLVNYSIDPKTGWIICYEQSYNTFLDKRNKLLYASAFVLLISLGLVFVIGTILARRTVRPIEQLVTAAEAIGLGDLTVKLQIKQKDEIGLLANNFNLMAGNLRDLVYKVLGSTDQVAVSAKQLTESAEQSAQATTQVAATISEVAQGASQQASAVETTTLAVEQMSEGIKQVALKAGAVSGVAEKTARAATEGDKTVSAAMSQMDSIEKAVIGSALVVTKLGERSKEIGQIVDTISNIAGQTNLLALNAAIEAARAGEQGRGFAVVAEEVRKLAEQSQEAAKQIATLISEIQAETGNAVDTMNEGSREVRLGADVVNKAGKAFKDIVSLIDDLTVEVGTISSAIQQTASGSQQIVASVKDIDRISKEAAGQTQTVSAATEEQSASMEEVAASSEALAELAKELQDAVKRFKV